MHVIKRYIQQWVGNIALLAAWREGRVPMEVIYDELLKDDGRAILYRPSANREGERFESGQVLQGFITGMDCVLRPVHASQLREHFGWNLWLHDGRPFPMLQLVYPTNEGIWPWSEMANDWLKRWQPLLEQPAYTD